MGGKTIRGTGGRMPRRRASLQQAVNSLREIPGVVGVAWGQPQRGDQWLDHQALVAHVRWKHDTGPKGERVPRAIQGFDTDVVEVGQAVTLSGLFDHSDSVVAPAGPYFRASTPTLLQVSDGLPVALVSGHGTLPIAGRAFRQPAGARLRLDDPAFGRAEGVLHSGAVEAGLDFALARFPGVDPKLWSRWHYVGGRPPVRTRRTRLLPGEALYHFSNLPGRRSRVRGFYRQNVLHDVELEDAHVGAVNLGALLFVQSISPQWPFALPGDSGSLVVDDDGTAVGVVVGSTRDRRWAYVMTLGNLGFLLSAEELGWFFK